MSKLCVSVDVYYLGIQHGECFASNDLTVSLQYMVVMFLNLQTGRRLSGSQWACEATGPPMQPY